MAKPYFRFVPDFNYTSRQKGSNSTDYTQVKNLFKRGKIREDIFGEISFFTKYSIIGDERPDSVAYKIYDDSTLDWIVLLANNIINVQDEWPLSQQNFENYLYEKYLNIETINAVHHYESKEVKTSAGALIFQKGIKIPNNYTISFYDDGLGTEVTTTNIAVPVTNLEYETQLQEDKRNIFVLKPRYLNIIFNDLETIMPYKKGSTQFESRTLKKGNKIKIYE